MNDLPSSTLLQQSHAHPKSGEELEMFGKQAASQYLSGHCDTLSEAVVETVKHAGLSPEQVRRVVEFTNTSAFLQEFRKEGSEHKVIEFDGGPASYSDVLKDLNDGGGGTVFDDGHDYEMPPPNTAKTASLNKERLGIEETKLAEAFDADDRSLPYAEPLRDALDMKDKLAGAHADLSQEINSLEIDYIQAMNDLHFSVKQAALGGTALGQILSAWQTVSDDPEFVKAAFSHLTPRLLSDGVFLSKDQLGDSLLKTASAGAVNPAHPVVQTFDTFCHTLSKLAQCRVAQQDVQRELEHMSTFLREITKTSSVAKSVLQAAGAVHHAAGEAAPVVGRHAKEIAEFATRYAPVAGAAYLGQKAYKGVSQHPATQAALSYLPGTEQHAIREYNKEVMRQQGGGG